MRRKPKAIRSYSLELEIIEKLERFCAQHDTWHRTKSRSQVVNDAIRWYLLDDRAQTIEANRKLREEFNRVCKEKAELEEKLRDTNRFDLN